MNQSFRFDYVSTGAAGSILRYYNPVVSGVGFSAEEPKFETMGAQGNYSSVRMSVQFSFLLKDFQLQILPGYLSKW